MKRFVIGLGCLAIAGCILTGCSKANAKYYYESAVYEFENKDYDKAGEYISNAIEQNPDKIEYYVCRGMVNVGLEKYEEAIADFDKVLSSDGQDEKSKENQKSAYRGRGIAYYYSTKYIEAIDDFEKALGYECVVEMNNDILKFKVEALLSSGDYEKATTVIDELIKSGEFDSDTYIQKGVCETKLKNYDSAKSYFDKAIKEDNNLAYYYLSILYKEQGLYDDAITTLKKYMNDDSDIDKGTIYCEIASSMIEAEQYDKAIEVITEGKQFCKGETLKIIMRDEIAAIEGKLDFADAYEKAKAYLVTYPDDEAMIREASFLETRIKQ